MKAMAEGVCPVSNNTRGVPGSYGFRELVKLTRRGDSPIDSGGKCRIQQSAVCGGIRSRVPKMGGVPGEPVDFTAPVKNFQTARDLGGSPGG